MNRHFDDFFDFIRNLRAEKNKCFVNLFQQRQAEALFIEFMESTYMFYNGIRLWHFNVVGHLRFDRKYL